MANLLSTILSGNNHITFGPNSTWSSYLRVGGNGHSVSGNEYASVVTTNGNLHLDSGTSRATYINYYAGTSGIAFGNGATSVVAWMGPDGDLWKGGGDNSGTQYVYNSGTWAINISGNAATASSAPANGGNSSTVAGLSVHSGRNNEADKIVRTDSNGYIQAGWINTTSGDEGNGTPDKFYGSNDNYIRYYTRAYTQMYLGNTYHYTTARRQHTTDTNYWVGTMGWGQTNWNDVGQWGSGFVDSWSSPANKPPSGGHHVGVQAFHYRNGSTAYGWQMAQGEGTAWYLRRIWGGGWSDWYTMITSDNIASQSVNYANSAGSANAVTWGNVSGKPSLDYQQDYTFTAPPSPDGSGYVWLRVAMGGFNGGGDFVRFSINRAIYWNGSSPYGGPSMEVTAYNREWHGGQEGAVITYGQHGSVPGSGWITHAGPRDLAGSGYWFYMRIWAGVDYAMRVYRGSGSVGTVWEETTDPTRVYALRTGVNNIGDSDVGLNTNGDVYGSRFYDYNDTTYYVDPGSTSKLVQVNLGTSNTRLIADSAAGYLKVYGSASNYLVVGPYNNNGWAYLESIGNSSGLYLYTESGGRFAFDNGDVTPYSDAENSLGNSSYRWSQIYTSGWLRQYGAQGMYNQDYGTHFYSYSGSNWGITGSGSNVYLAFRSNHESTIRGYVHANTDNNIGFLNNSGDWGLRVSSARNVEVFGTDLIVGSAGGGYTSITMKDGDEGDRVIHCNSNRIGFLNQSGSWGAWCDDSGNWATAGGLEVAGNSSWFGGYGSGSGPGIALENLSTFARFAFWGLDFYDWNNGIQMTINDGYVSAANSFRAPIFYDSNDTYYYVDPNSTSRLVSTRIIGGEIRFQNGSYYNNLEYWGARMFSQDDGNGVPLYVQVQWSDGWRAALKIASGIDDNNPSLRTYYTTQLATDSGNVSIGGTASSHKLHVYGTGYATSDFRAPIFYDSENTGYYVDPASRSNLNMLTLSGAGHFFPNTWTELSGYYGLYSPYNGAHFYPNNGTYGSWRSAGSRNGWNGIEFDASNGQVVLMVNPSSNTTGFHNNSYGWQFYWENGTLYCNKNSYGGGSTAAVLDSSNASYAWNMNQYVRTSDDVMFASATTQTFLVANHSDNTKGYRIHNTSGSSVSAMFTNSSNFLVIGAGAFNQINLNKQVYINGVGLGVGSIGPSPISGRIDASNDIVAYSSSDERLKENITPIENALDKVKSLTGVEFDWKPEYKHAHGYEGHDTGIIAQQVQEVIPSAVRTNDTGFLAVRYEKLIGLLVEGMKEQQAQIEELKAKLDGLTK